MTPLEAFRKVRIWGLRGAFAALAKIVRTRKAIKAIKGSIDDTIPIPGFTLIADFTSKASLSKTMRDLALALDAAEIPFQAINIREGSDINTSDEISKILTPPTKFKARKYSHVIDMLGFPNIEIPEVARLHIAFWEFDSGILENLSHLVGRGTVLAMSDFNQKIYKRAFPASTPIRKLLYPFRLPDTTHITPQDHVRNRFGIPSDSFAVFFNVGLGSARKNPEGCIRAFAKAFPCSDSKTTLVFKTMHAKSAPECLDSLVRLAQDLNLQNRVVFINDYLTDLDVLSLTAACDCYLSLHRGEGFGLGIAEAMSLGKPVVVTDYSSTTEFCNETNSIPIPFKIEPMRPSRFDKSAYRGVTTWAEPDIASAAHALAALHTDPLLRKQIGEQAQKSIRRQFSSESFKTSALKLLECSNESAS